ncbi:transposase [Longispora sp. NPDC051575]|uniref:RNA-guided endonuclease InsQ/TnpB family protein n=1 Tax=Longispora sp. NPDC051575 TaxID=3154943 RepID=UPI00341868DF
MGTLLTGRRYRLAPTPEQAGALEQWAGACRSVWNTGLHQRREYRRRGAWISYVEQARQMADAKTEFPWLTEPPADVLQQTLMDLDRACRDRGTRAARWRGRSRWAPSMRMPQRGNSHLVERLGRKVGRVKLPKLGWVAFRWSRPPGGTVRSATVSYTAGQWWVSLLVEDGQTTPGKHDRPDTAVGVDRGVVVAVATSDGRLADRGFTTPGEQRRMLALQRRASRQERHRRAHAAKTSQRAKNTRAQLGRMWARIRDRRADFCHQLAHDLCADNALVGIEALRITNMTASAAGTIERPGRNVAQKSGLNRAILTKGWGQFELALRNQARRTGTTVLRVDPAYTSRTCNACGHNTPDNRESQAVFRCVACGLQAHADVNAACNILARALRATGRDGHSPPVNNGRISHQGPPFVPRQPPARAEGSAESPP